MVRSTTNFPDFTDLSVNQISISSHTTQRSALHSISLSTSTVPSTASTATVVPGAPTITNHSDALGMAIILGITIPLGVLVLALVFIVVVFYWFRKHRAKQDVVLLHYGETGMPMAIILGSKLVLVLNFWPLFCRLCCYGFCSSRAI